MKPTAGHLSGIKLTLEDLLELNLTARTRTEINGALTYVTSFICVIMSVLWYKVFIPIDFCNKLIQARDAILNVEVSNIKGSTAELTNLRNNWKSMWEEAKLVASNLDIEAKLYSRIGTKCKRMFYDDSNVTTDADLSQLNQADE